MKRPRPVAASAEARTGAWKAAPPEDRGLTALQWAIRAGFWARGLTYAIMGGLALALALGAGTFGEAPNQQGALSLIARAGVGRVALVVVAVSLLAYAIWKFWQGIRGRGPEGGGGTGLIDRLGNLGGGIVYVGFCLVAVRILVGSAGNASAQPRQATTGVLGWPGGRVIVAVAGLVLIAISLHQLYITITTEFAQDVKTAEMSRREQRVFMFLGQVGLPARALVFALVGYFLLRAAIDYDPRSAVGTDGALARLYHEPLGPWLLGLVAAGLLIFAAFSALEGRYRRL
jgi:hypothetical protein